MELERGTFENLKLIEHILARQEKIVESLEKSQESTDNLVSWSAMMPYTRRYSIRLAIGFFGFHFDKQVENTFFIPEAANYGFFFYANDRYAFMD